MKRGGFYDFVSILKQQLYEIRWLGYSCKFGGIQYKTTLNEAEPFHILNLKRRGHPKPAVTLDKLYNGPRKIPKEKKKDLIDLLPLIDPMFHLANSRGPVGWCTTNLRCGRLWVRILGKAWVVTIGGRSLSKVWLLDTVQVSSYQVCSHLGRGERQQEQSNPEIPTKVFQELSATHDVRDGSVTAAECKARGAGVLRESSPANGNVRHVSHKAKVRTNPQGIKSGSPRWEASGLTSTPPRDPTVS
ncbi:hypothetical protein PR048_014594 [Dryococelus australis]|uniref:Uncharacterized protein n=1 Tax=Dryococelus australis TaxID=614101 RepID=A0ABQ9HEM7_9NEOP|nr:hypothetical protein PR048_014594 [Dryococelus australis]